MTHTPSTLPGFRDRIAVRYKWFGWMAGIGIILCLFSSVWWEQITFLRSLLALAAWICYFFLSYIYMHRQRMIDALDKDAYRAEGHFDTYLTGQHQRWEKHAFARLIIGSILVAVTLALVIFSTGRLGQWMAALFVSFVLGVMVKNWMQFCEQIMLHDYRRILRDQPADISD